MRSTEWFADAVRPDVVTAELVRTEPALASGRLVLLGCRVSRVRSLPAGGSWTANYHLDLHDPETGHDRTIVATGLLTPPGVMLPTPQEDEPLGADGWSRVLPALRLWLLAADSDPDLPGLATVTDPEQARELLQEQLPGRGGLPAGLTVTRCTPTVVTHKLGARATVLCRFESVDGPTSLEAVVVKVHRGSEGEHAYQAMLTVWESRLAAGPALGLAEPLAYVPELGLSIQQYVAHRCSLKDLFHSAFKSGRAETWAELVAATKATAAGLAALHRCGSAVGSSVTWEQEYGAVRQKNDRLVAAVPAMRELTDGALGRLDSAASRTTADPSGPAHHSFRPSQVLVRDDAVAFIDFDKFCQAEPGSDIALFVSKLRHMGRNKVESANPEQDPNAKVDLLVDTFLEEYRRNAPVSAERVALWLGLELVSLVLSAVKKANPVWTDNCHQLLEHHLDTNGF